MNEVDERALEAFGKWLSTLATDTSAVLDVVANAEVAAAARTPLAGGLNYLFKSLDLIDDGIEGLGFLDDAFVLRVACAHARSEGELSPELVSLSEQAELVQEFLGPLAPRLERFVRGLTQTTVRGRSVDAIVSDPSVCEELVGDVRGWASRYSAPHFVLDERGLVKLRAFLGAKLPA